MNQERIPTEKEEGRKKLSKADAKQIQRRDDWESVTNTVHGRRVMNEILGMTGLLDCSYCEPSLIQFKAGMKSVGAWLTYALKNSKTLKGNFLRMQAEAMEAEEMEKVNE